VLASSRRDSCAVTGTIGSLRNIDDGWVLKYIAALILFGILGVKSVDDALTKRKNLPTMSKGKNFAGRS